jgi:hypothetical protein
VHLDGEVIPLKQEYSLRIAGAVVELRKRSTSLVQTANVGLGLLGPGDPLHSGS